MSQKRADLKIANCVFRDGVHELYQDVLYCQNVCQFHGTSLDLFLFMPVRILQPSVRQFSQNPRSLGGIMGPHQTFYPTGTGTSVIVGKVRRSMKLIKTRKESMHEAWK